jgi:nitroimidazol reductase NimA-like FMN-containing flavoprotein (pyridoxamine 5'-phosphate oxidase superfamily)
MTTERGHTLVELSRAECLELLDAHDFGRLVLITASDETPMIRPVKYGFDGASQSIVFRTGDGAKLFALSHGARAWFELDGIDTRTRSGWSVIVGGVVEEVTQPFEVQRLDQLGLDSWAPGDDPRWIRIVARTVSGRRITP